jgi:hypothetical protein
MTQGSFRGFNGFVQDVSPREASAPKPELELDEKVLVVARSTSCKCVVTAVAYSPDNVRSFVPNKCRRDHDAIIKKLTAAATFRALVMADSVACTPQVLKNATSTKETK